MSFSGGETIQVLPRQDGPPDAHGRPQYTWAAPESNNAVDVEGVRVAPSTSWSSETGEPGREAVNADLALYCPPGTRAAAVDRVHVRSETFEIIGEPEVWPRPWEQGERGVVIYARRPEG